MNSEMSVCNPGNRIDGCYTCAQQDVEEKLGRTHSNLKPCFYCGHHAEIVFSTIGGDWSAQCSNWNDGEVPWGHPDYWRKRHGQPWTKRSHTAAATREDAMALWNDGVIL